MDRLERDSLDKVVCAITGKSIKREDAVEVGLFFQDGSNQGMFMSKEGIDGILHESIPRYPEMLPDNNN